MSYHSTGTGGGGTFDYRVSYTWSLRVGLGADVHPPSPPPPGRSEGVEGAVGLVGGGSGDGGVDPGGSRDGGTGPGGSRGGGFDPGVVGTTGSPDLNDNTEGPTPEGDR